jgi:hypothetical protein
MKLFRQKSKGQRFAIINSNLNDASLCSIIIAISRTTYTHYILWNFWREPICNLFYTLHYANLCPRCNYFKHISEEVFNSLDTEVKTYLSVYSINYRDEKGHLSVETEYLNQRWEEQGGLKELNNEALHNSLITKYY